MNRFVASFALVCALLAGEVSAQSRAMVTAPPMPDMAADTGSPLAYLTITSDSKYWYVTHAAALPQAYSILFLSHTLAPWYIDFGAQIGAVDLSVYQPLDIFAGMTDQFGTLHVQVPKPGSIPPDIDGQVFYAQMASVQLTPNVDGQSLNPSYSFSIRLSHLSSFVMAAAFSP